MVTLHRTSIVTPGLRIILTLPALLLTVGTRLIVVKIYYYYYYNISGKCESSAKQYYDKVVLGIDKAILSPTAEWSDNVTKITNETYALTELGKIGDIKWDITLCLLLS